MATEKFWIADLDEFYIDFVEDAIFKGIKTIKVHFSEEFEITTPEGIVGVESNIPNALCKDSDITGVKHGDTLGIKTITYKVVEIRRKGTGLTKLILER